MQVIDIFVVFFQARCLRAMRRGGAKRRCNGKGRGVRSSIVRRSAGGRAPGKVAFRVFSDGPFALEH